MLRGAALESRGKERRADEQNVAICPLPSALSATAKPAKLRRQLHVVERERLLHVVVERCGLRLGAAAGAATRCAVRRGAVGACAATARRGAAARCASPSASRCAWPIALRSSSSTLFLLEALRDFAAVFAVFRRFLAMRAPPVEWARILSDKLVARVLILRVLLSCPARCLCPPRVRGSGWRRHAAG